MRPGSVCGVACAVCRMSCFVCRVSCDVCRAVRVVRRDDNGRGDGRLVRPAQIEKDEEQKASLLPSPFSLHPSPITHLVRRQRVCIAVLVVLCSRRQLHIPNIGVTVLLRCSPSPSVGAPPTSSPARPESPGGPGGGGRGEGQEGAL